MKIKMLTIKCGPETSENWDEGQVREVCDEEGAYWKKFRVAEDYPKAMVTVPEKAVTGPAEKAVVAPQEKAAKGVVAPPAVKAPEAPPASPSNVNSSAKAATWGTPEVK
jgi:hypothetical protein